jgi:hypothetical protein
MLVLEDGRLVGARVDEGSTTAAAAPGDGVRLTLVVTVPGPFTEVRIGDLVVELPA